MDRLRQENCPEFRAPWTTDEFWASKNKQEKKTGKEESTWGLTCFGGLNENGPTGLYV